MKKALSLMLVLVLVLGMSTTVFAATNYKVNKDNEAITFEFVTNGTDTSSDNTIDVDRLAQDSEANRTLKFKINVASASTTSSAGDTVEWGSASGAKTKYMTEKQRKDSKFTIKTNIKKGSKAIDEVTFKSEGTGTSAVQCLALVLKDELATNDSDGVDFEVTSYIVVNGTHWNSEGNRVTWSGNLTNTEDDVTEDYDYVYMGDGKIVNAEAYIKEIECDLDNGVSVFAKMFNGKSYWAKSNTDPTDAQVDIMDKYGIDEVYNVSNAGLNAVANYVLLNDADPDYFVYDSNLKLLGKGSDQLPLTGTYYLAASEIETDEEIEPDEGDEIPSDEIEKPVDGGGDDFYPENANDNPGTGC